jgi:hypothetical protein
LAQPPDQFLRRRGCVEDVVTLDCDPLTRKGAQSVSQSLVAGAGLPLDIVPIRHGFSALVSVLRLSSVAEARPA